MTKNRVIYHFIAPPDFSYKYIKVIPCKLSIQIPRRKHMLTTASISFSFNCIFLFRNFWVAPQFVRPQQNGLSVEFKSLYTSNLATILLFCELHCYVLNSHLDCQPWFIFIRKLNNYDRKPKSFLPFPPTILDSGNPGLKGILVLHI